MSKRAFPTIATAMIAATGAGAVTAFVTPGLAQGLPNGKGKELVQMACLDCHDLSPITGAGFSRTEWDTIVKSMADMGANIRREDIPVVVEYLAASFPPKTKQ
jgi:cytochrome c5